VKRAQVDGVTSQASTTLRKAGQRLTRHRVAVMSALRTSDRPLTAEEVAKISGVPLSTAYRNLAELCDAGVAVRVGGADRTDRFEIAESLTSHHHHHLVEALAVDRGEDRTTGGAGRLAVIAGAIVAADPVRPAVVGGIGIRDLREERERGIGCLRRCSLRKEATVFDLERMRGRCRQRVERHCPSARRSSGSGASG